MNRKFCNTTGCDLLINGDTILYYKWGRLYELMGDCIEMQSINENFHVGTTQNK